MCTAEKLLVLEHDFKILLSGYAGILKGDLVDIRKYPSGDKLAPSYIMKVIEENEKEFIELKSHEGRLSFTLDEMIEAVQYGFDYHKDSQNDGEAVPVGNTLQWLMGKYHLLNLPPEFEKLKQKSL